MKILHVVPSYYPAFRYGGPIESVHTLNKWLIEQGAEVTVYTTNANGPETLQVEINKEIILDGVKVFYFPLSFPQKWFYSYKLHKALKKNIKNFDLVHETSVFLSTSTLAARIAKKARIPYIISPRGNLMIKPLQKSKYKKNIYIYLIEKWNLKNASAIHFTIPVEEKEYKDKNLPVLKSICIPNGFDSKPFSLDIPKGVFRKKWHIAENAPLVLFFSRISWKKGFDTLIPSFVRVLEEFPEARLVIAGGDDEGYEKNVKEQTSKFKIEGRVIFTGMLTGNERSAAYQDSDIFVLPSYSENFGNVVLEAGYFGLPVIITPEVGVADDVKKNNAGIVVEKNAEKFSEAIISLLHNKKRGEEMGKNGWKMVLRDFTPQKIAEKWMGEYSKIIEK